MISQEEETVTEWRVKRLREGGWTKTNAQLIATTSLDYRYACEILKECKKKGLDESFVIKLIL